MGGHVQAIDAQFKVSHSSYYSLLIVVPEEVDSYEAVNVLNFFGFPFNLEEDNIINNVIKKEMAFAKEDDYPCLVVESASPEVPNLDLSSTPSIFRELQEKKLIGIHEAHSAREKQTRLEFLDMQVAPLFEAILMPFKNRLYFYMVPRHF